MPVMSWVNIDAWEKIWHLCIRSSSVNIAYRHAAVYYVHNRMIIKQQYFQEKENLLFLQPLWLSDSVGHWIESVICLVYLHMQNVDDQSIGHRTMSIIYQIWFKATFGNMAVLKILISWFYSILKWTNIES